MVFGFCLQRFALECEIPTRVASVVTQRTMQQCQAEACSITHASSQKIVAIQPHNCNTLLINLKGGSGISATTAQTASAAPTVPTATQSPTSSRHTHQARPLPPQGWRLNSKTCVHCPQESTNKRVGTKTGAVCHAVARCVRIMHLVCCVGESVPHHTCYAAGYATPAVRPPKGNPKCICLPSVEMYGGRRKTKLTVFFFEPLVTPLRERFGAYGILYNGAVIGFLIVFPEDVFHIIVNLRDGICGLPFPPRVTICFGSG